MKTTPHIDWAAIALAESNDPAAAAFNRSTKMKRYLSLGLLYCCSRRRSCTSCGRTIKSA